MDKPTYDELVAALRALTALPNLQIRHHLRTGQTDDGVKPWCPVCGYLPVAEAERHADWCNVNQGRILLARLDAAEAEPSLDIPEPGPA